MKNINLTNEASKIVEPQVIKRQSKNEVHDNNSSLCLNKADVDKLNTI